MIARNIYLLNLQVADRGVISTLNRDLTATPDRNEVQNPPTPTGVIDGSLQPPLQLSTVDNCWIRITQTSLVPLEVRDTSDLRITPLWRHGRETIRSAGTPRAPVRSRSFILPYTHARPTATPGPLRMKEKYNALLLEPSFSSGSKCHPLTPELAMNSARAKRGAAR